jgi:hypothetical protein
MKAAAGSNLLNVVLLGCLAGGLSCMFLYLVLSSMTW